VSGLTYPEYCVAGEFGMSDPDGYCLLVGQRTEDGPEGLRRDFRCRKTRHAASLLEICC